MTQGPQENPQLTVLGIFAHPDDEAFGSGGTLAELVQKGHRVTTVCATNGDVGEISDPALATPENLWQVRQGELRDAMAVTGISDVRFLGYRDSGMDGTPDNDNPASMFRADAAKVDAQISAVMEELTPDIVITHDPTGGYGHPDHVTVYQRTTAVVESMTMNRPLWTTFAPQRLASLTRRCSDGGSTVTTVGLSNIRLNMGDMPPRASSGTT